MFNYAQMNLDRASQQRKDATWIKEKKQADSKWILTYQDKNLFLIGEAEPVFLSRQQLGALDTENAIFLGHQDEEYFFALDVSDCDEATLKAIGYFGEFVDLRRYGGAVFGEQASILALSRGVCYWHRTHRYCGRCGAQNRLAEAGHARRCTNKTCHHLTFPRTDPAVIMLVTTVFDDGIERCLLGRQKNWPTGALSTLAGFVDPGETLEQAVVREVMEEAGIVVSHAQYLASQPWPFPSSIMLGFIATASSQTIKVDQDELEYAQWFTKAQLDSFAQWGEETDEFKLPRKDSISRFLIEQWRQQD